MQTRNEIHQELAAHSFLQGIDEWYLEQLERYAQRVRYKPGDFVFHEGDDADHFYLTLSGDILLTSSAPDGKEIFAGRLAGHGDLFGWSWLIPPYRYRFNAQVLKPSAMISLHGKYLRVKCEEDHDLGYELMKRLILNILEELQPPAFGRIFESVPRPGCDGQKSD